MLAANCLYHYTTKAVCLDCCTIEANDYTNTRFRCRVLVCIFKFSYKKKKNFRTDSQQLFTILHKVFTQLKYDELARFLAQKLEDNSDLVIYIYIQK